LRAEGDLLPPAARFRSGLQGLRREALHPRANPVCARFCRLRSPERAARPSCSDTAGPSTRIILLAFLFRGLAYRPTRANTSVNAPEDVHDELTAALDEIIADGDEHV